MTLRDLLTNYLTPAYDYITLIDYLSGRVVLDTIPIAEMHPVWLNYEIMNYLCKMHSMDENTIDFDVAIDIKSKILQEKTSIDEILERYAKFERNVKEYESTNNN